MAYAIKSPDGFWEEREQEFVEKDFTVYDSFEEADEVLTEIYALMNEFNGYKDASIKMLVSEFLAETFVYDLEA